MVAVAGFNRDYYGDIDGDDFADYQAQQIVLIAAISILIGFVAAAGPIVAFSAIVVVGGLEQILEIGSITFIVASLLMAWANLKKRKETGTRTSLAVLAVLSLGASAAAILYYQWRTNRMALGVTLGVYVALIVGSSLFASRAAARGVGGTG